MKQNKMKERKRVFAGNCGPKVNVRKGGQGQSFERKRKVSELRRGVNCKSLKLVEAWEMGGEGMGVGVWGGLRA